MKHENISHRQIDCHITQGNNGEDEEHTTSTSQAEGVWAASLVVPSLSPAEDAVKPTMQSALGILPSPPTVMFMSLCSATEEDVSHYKIMMFLVDRSVHLSHQIYIYLNVGSIPQWNQT